ncbi:hypothetical protein HZA75_06515 [Candidatus Roizmanbacteria bacterium]|nr:hypothetical protein [Candidatus Roizmanbacteria bacterium]
MNLSHLVSRRPLILVLFFTIISVFLHFYNLNWGAPFYFHPDELNIATSVAQLQFPNQMNPHFFAYGSLPIYTIYFTGFLINIISNPLQSTTHNLQPNFEQAILISRFYSALFATLLIPLIFVIARSIATKQSQMGSPNGVGLIAALLTTFSVGIIQFSHFGTFEIWLTFFTTLLFWCCLFIKQHATTRLTIVLALLTGTLVSIKISHVAIIPMALFVITLQEIIQNKNRHHLLKFISILRGFLLFFFIVFFIYLLTNPYVFIDTKSFIGSMQYESSLALGTLPVFYTGEFFNQLPVVFQFLHIYPFLINPLLTIIFIPSFLYIIWKALKTKNLTYILLTAFYLILFSSQAFLFAKWTRYMVPTLPFIYLTIALAFYDVIARNKTTKQSPNRLLHPLKLLTVIILIFINFLFAISYFITAFVKPDTRIDAFNFAKQIIPSGATILSETYDLGITPFNELPAKIELVNFYDLDNFSNLTTFNNLKNTLEQKQYIILPSQRILKSRIINQNKFPNGNLFYKQLLGGRLGYTKIYETPCDIFCKIIYLEDPVFSFEQTASVFDRPTVMIFKRT